MTQLSPRLKCPKCFSSQIYLRFKTKEIVCKSCGAITPLSDLFFRPQKQNETIKTDDSRQK